MPGKPSFWQRSYSMGHSGSTARCRGASSSAREYCLTLFTGEIQPNLCRLTPLQFPWCTCGKTSAAMSLGPNTCPDYLHCSVRLGQGALSSLSYIVAKIKRTSLLQKKASLFFDLGIFLLCVCTSPEINRFSTAYFLQFNHCSPTC